MTQNAGKRLGKSCPINQFTNNSEYRQTGDDTELDHEAAIRSLFRIPGQCDLQRQCKDFRTFCLRIPSRWLRTGCTYLFRRNAVGGREVAFLL